MKENYTKVQNRKFWSSLFHVVNKFTTACRGECRKQAYDGQSPFLARRNERNPVPSRLGRELKEKSELAGSPRMQSSSQLDDARTSFCLQNDGLEFSKFFSTAYLRQQSRNFYTEKFDKILNAPVKRGRSFYHFTGPSTKTGTGPPLQPQSRWSRQRG
mgnify:CR=1 FL=1